MKKKVIVVFMLLMGTAYSGGVFAADVLLSGCDRVSAEYAESLNDAVDISFSQDEFDATLGACESSEPKLESISLEKPDAGLVCSDIVGICIVPNTAKPILVGCELGLAACPIYM